MRIVFLFFIILLSNFLIAAPQPEKNYSSFNIKPHFFTKNDKNTSKIRQISSLAYFKSEDIVRAYGISPMPERPARKPKALELLKFLFYSP